MKRRLQVRELSKYADEVAGGLMVTEFLSYSEEATVSDVVEDLRHNVEKYRDTKFNMHT